MNNQEMYSLAIQALHERRDRLQRQGGWEDAVKECEETIIYLQRVKEADQVLNGFINTCTGKIEFRSSYASYDMEQTNE